jgi:hypothetical protein
VIKMVLVYPYPLFVSGPVAEEAIVLVQDSGSFLAYSHNAETRSQITTRSDLLSFLDILKISSTHL